MHLIIHIAHCVQEITNKCITRQIKNKSKKDMNRAQVKRVAAPAHHEVL